MRLGRIILIVLLGSLLAACGGGGGGSSGGSGGGGDFTLAQTTVNFSAALDGFQPNSIEIRGSLKNAKGQVYFVVDISKTNLVQDAYVEVTSDSTGILTLVPASPSSLSVGEHVGQVTVRACKNASCSSEYSGSPKTLTVNYKISASGSGVTPEVPLPDFSISTDSINFTVVTDKVLPQPVVVTLLSSENPMRYGHSMGSDVAEWLSIQTHWNGTNGTATFSVTKELPVGTYTANIALFAHDEALSKSLTVTYVVKDGHQLSLSRPALSYMYADASSLDQIESFSIAGKITTDWELEVDVDWLTLSTDNGSTADNAAINVSLNDSVMSLAKGIHKTTIFVKNLDDQDLGIHLPITVYVLDKGIEVTQSTANLLDFYVTDVVTDKVGSRFFISDKYTKRVYQVDVTTGLTMRYFEFEKMPERMAISPNGEKLYIALLDGEHSSYWWDEDQSGAIAMVDLAQNAVLGSFDIDIDPYDLVATDAGKIVVASGSGQWTTIKAYDAANGQEVGSASIRQASHLSLHPNQNWVFAADTDVSPSDIEKFDISGVGITALGDSPYHGAYRIYGNVWATPNGKNVITLGGDVFLASSMEFSKSMVLNSSITDLAFNTDNNTAVVITSDNALQSYSLVDYSLVMTLANNLIGPRFVMTHSGNVYVISYEDGEFLLTEH